MANAEHELLYIIAYEYAQIEHVDKIRIGMKMKLFDYTAHFWPEDMVEETVFTNAYKNGKLNILVQEMEKIKHGK